jgi:hypothetical protein
MQAVGVVPYAVGGRLPTPIDGSRSGSTSEKGETNMDMENTSTGNDEALFPTCYFDQTRFVELRRYVCLDMARACGAAPDNMVRVAHDMERFLIGHGRIANDRD